MCHSKSLHPTGTDPYVAAKFPENLSGVKILDVGCGWGHWGFLLRSRDLNAALELVGVDVFPPYVEHCKRFYNRVYCAKVPPLPTREFFDYALCSEVLEHMPKEEGQTLLEELTEMSDTVIVTTPMNALNYCGFTQFQGNPYNDHVSSWEPRDFNSEWTVEIIQGGQYTRLLRFVEKLRRVVFGLQPMVKYIIATWRREA